MLSQRVWNYTSPCLVPRAIVRLLAGIILLPHVALSAESATSMERIEADLIPLEIFAANPTYEDIKVSPKGDYLAATFFNPDDVTESKLVVLDIENMEVTAVAHVRGRDFISDFFWANEERIVGQIARKVGWQDQPFRTGDMVAMNWDGKRKRWIFGQRKRGGRSVSGASVLSTLPDEPKKILIAANNFAQRDGSYTEAILLDIYNGRERRVTRAPVRNAQLIADHVGNIRYAFASNPEKDNASEIHKKTEEGWALISSYPSTAGSVVPVGFSPGNDSIYILDNAEFDTQTLLELNPATGSRTQIYHHPTVDISSLEMNRDGGLVGVYMEPDYPLYVPLDTDSAFGQSVAHIHSTFRGYRVSVSSTSRDGSLMTLSVESDISPKIFFLYQTETKQFVHLADIFPAVTAKDMALMTPYTLTVRDGESVPVYLTLPTNGKAPYPMVVLPHGGPHGVRDYWKFDPYVQMLASRGYAVLQVNFRGSGGYGRDFLYSGYRRWGLEMQDDVTDATLWAISEGITDRESVCIFGASYGGYASLMGAVKEPDLYSCAIVYVGVYDLEMMLEEGDIPFTLAGRNYLEQALGDDRVDLYERSPINHIEKLTAPLLIVHGAQDQRVPLLQAEALRERMDALDKPYEWLVKPNEGHGFYDKDNKIELFTTMLTFLERNLTTPTAEN